MDRAKALQKIRKLLKLSGSSNPNESATALRQAQALMRHFEVSEVEIGTIDVAERLVKIRGRPVYIIALAEMIGDAFGCKPIGLKGPQGNQIAFVGNAGNAEMAEYGFTVLRRQLESDRREHLARVRSAKNRAARGDQFGLAWVAAVRRLVDRYADGLSPAVEQYIATKYPALKTVEVKARTTAAAARAAEGDAHAGYCAGRNAQLARGVAGAEQLRLGAP